jgi:hypothetical protein
MKKLITLLSVPIIALVTACTPKAPAETDYFTGTAPISLGPYVDATAKDIDKDGLGDAVISREGKAVYYAKGYESDLNITKMSVEMTPEIRKDIGDFIKADNSLRYHDAKARYERYLQDTTGVKK